MSADYTVIVPVYNSQETLEELYSRIKYTFENLGNTFQVIFIDDYSADDSWNVISKLKTDHSDRIKAVKLSRNYGQHNAILCGLNFVEDSDVILIDDDLQTPPEEIVKLIAHQKETQENVVYGIYSNKKHSLIRNMGSYLTGRIFKYFANNR